MELEQFVLLVRDLIDSGYDDGFEVFYDTHVKDNTIHVAVIKEGGEYPNDIVASFDLTVREA